MNPIKPLHTGLFILSCFLPLAIQLRSEAKIHRGKLHTDGQENSEGTEKGLGCCCNPRGPLQVLQEWHKLVRGGKYFPRLTGWQLCSNSHGINEHRRACTLYSGLQLMNVHWLLSIPVCREHGKWHFFTHFQYNIFISKGPYGPLKNP